MGKRGQVAMEYLVLVGFVMIITIPLVVLFSTNSDSIKDQLNHDHLYGLGQKIVSSAETVHSLGSPSRTTIRSYFPEGIRGIRVGPRALIFNVSQGDVPNEIVVVSSVNITGTLDPSQGHKDIVIEAFPGYVSITS